MWLTVCVEDDRQWRGLCEVLGRPDWFADESLASAQGRHDQHDMLDAGLAEWAASKLATKAMRELQAAGVGAGTVNSAEGLLADEHYQATGFFAIIDRRGVGPHPYNGFFAHLSETPARMRRPAPWLGEHNHEILSGLLGCDAAEMARLEAADITGTVPESGI
jgi:crotonobetainyl-CoA:carnitine CoA-transferase CaiB-like acyl-CoA transferase